MIRLMILAISMVAIALLSTNTAPAQKKCPPPAPNIVSYAGNSGVYITQGNQNNWIVTVILDYSCTTAMTVSVLVYDENAAEYEPMLDKDLKNTTQTVAAGNGTLYFYYAIDGTSGWGTYCFNNLTDDAFTSVTYTDTNGKPAQGPSEWLNDMAGNIPGM